MVPKYNTNPEIVTDSPRVATGHGRSPMTFVRLTTFHAIGRFVILLVTYLCLPSCGPRQIVVHDSIDETRFKNFLGIANSDISEKVERYIQQREFVYSAVITMKEGAIGKVLAHRQYEAIDEQSHMLREFDHQLEAFESQGMATASDLEGLTHYYAMDRETGVSYYLSVNPSTHLLITSISRS